MAGHMSGNPNQDAFTGWLHSNYVSRETLDQRLAALADDLTAKVLVMVADAQQGSQREQATQEKTAEVTQEQIDAALLYAGVGEQQVRQMIEAALIKYSADKTGLPDFALESAGMLIIGRNSLSLYVTSSAKTCFMVEQCPPRLAVFTCDNIYGLNRTGSNKSVRCRCSSVTYIVGSDQMPHIMQGV